MLLKHSHYLREQVNQAFVISAERLTYAATAATAPPTGRSTQPCPVTECSGSAVKIRHCPATVSAHPSQHHRPHECCPGSPTDANSASGREASRTSDTMERVSQETGSATHINHAPGGERRSRNSCLHSRAAS